MADCCVLTDQSVFCTLYVALLDCLQFVKAVFPLLLIFGEDETDSHSAGNLEIAFAAVLPQLQTAAALLRQLTLLVVNQLSQLGALCSEQTRKSTVISGTIMHIVLQHNTALVALLTSLSRRSSLILDQPIPCI